jgi:hypothetical protein
MKAKLNENEKQKCSSFLLHLEDELCFIELINEDASLEIRRASDTRPRHLSIHILALFYIRFSSQKMPINHLYQY